MQNELKPCPFCGGDAVLVGGNVKVIPEIDEGGAYVDADFYVEPAYVKCSVCGASSDAFYEDDNDIDNAKAAWNRRVGDAD